MTAPAEGAIPVVNKVMTEKNTERVASGHGRAVPCLTTKNDLESGKLRTRSRAGSESGRAGFSGR